VCGRRRSAATSERPEGAAARCRIPGVEARAASGRSDELKEEAPMPTGRVQLGLRANAKQFSLLVGLNALVGAMVGLERSVLPLVGEHDFDLRSNAAILAFVVAFGAAKALTNLVSGDLAERIGRKRLLVIGWLVAAPVPLLIGLASSWWWII